MLQSFPRPAAWLIGRLILVASLLVPALSPTAQAAPTDVPTPLVLDNVEEWAAGAGLLYWAHNCYADEFNPFAALKRMPAAGGTQRTLESINDGALCSTYQTMLSASDGLYYFDYSQKRIERMPLSEPYTPQVVKTLSDNQFPTVSRPFVEAGGYLYWIHFANKIYRVLKDGSGSVETVADTAASPADVMVVGNTVYWTDSQGVWTTSIACGSLPCTGDQQQFAPFGANTSGYGLLYQFLGGALGNYRVYWVQRVTSGANADYQIRYRSCNNIAACTVVSPNTFYTGTTNWRIGYLVIANNNLYWTEADHSTLSNNNGDVKRRAYNAAGSGADTIATGQAKIDDQLYVANNMLFFARQGNGIYSLPLNASAILRDLKADGMEVTQAIQNLANEVPLVADKTTYVRAYGQQLSGPSAPNVEARLVGTKNGVPLPGSPLRPLNGVRALVAGGGYDRARLNDGWYFLLPANWTTPGTVALKVEIDPRQIHTDPNRGDNELSKSITFQKQPPVCVWTVPVRTHTSLPSTGDPNFWTMVSHFKRRWPVPDVWIFRDTDPVEELQLCWWGPVPHPCYGPYELEEGWSLTNGIPDRDKVIVSLWGRALLSFNPDACDDIGAPVHFMGMVHPDAKNGGAAGYASTVSKQSWVQLPKHIPNPVPAGWDRIREGSVMAQELAHNYGRKHINCGNPDNVDNNYPYPPCQIANTGPASHYGFDTTTLQPIRPDQTADFMSYTSRSWLSDYTWRALLGAFLTANVTAAAPLAVDAGNSVFVTGLVDTANSRGEISLILVLPTSSVPLATRQVLSVQAAGVDHGDAPHAVYKLRLLDPVGTVLVERTLTLTPLDDHTTESNAALFSDLFAQPAGKVATVQLLADATVIDSVTPGANSPTVSIQKPEAGAVIDSNLKIQWTASDPDPDDRLLFTVQYSHNNGASWHTLALNLPGTLDPSNALDLSDLGSLHGSGPNTALVRVLASDGYNTAIATSQPFTLKNRPPEPVISEPVAGQTFAGGQDVLLSGSATDAEDGGLAGAALKWQVDGASNGEGSDVIAAGLASGAHTAALAATDSNNQTVTTTVTFNVAPLSVPLAAAPVLDGYCDDAAYADGTSLLLKPYGNGTQANVRLLRSDAYLWACFSGLQQGAPTPGSYAGVRVDIDYSRDAQVQVSDAGFFAGEDGDVFTMKGDGAGNLVSPGLGGLQAQVGVSGSSWSAELRIDKAALNGWDHLVGLSVGHHAVATQGDDYPWPYSAGWGQPNTWGAAALGAQPLIRAMDPISATVSGPAFTLAIQGSGLISGTTVLWNGIALPTTFVDDEHLTVQVATAQLNNAAMAQIKALSPAPGNFASNEMAFVVEALTPAITSLSPTSVVAGNPTMTLTVNGSNFAQDAQLLWNGQPLATQYVNATQVKAQIDATLLATGQIVGVAVRNQLPDTRSSAAVPFEVKPGPFGPASQRAYLPVIMK